MSDDLGQEYFADGLVDDVITALSRFKAFFVIARHSSFTYKGKVVDIKHIGQELGVRYVLEGSVRKADTQLRINAQLIDVATCTHLWAHRFDGAFGDIFDGDFAAVTAFEFRAHRVGPMILGGMLVFRWEDARDALRACRDLMAGAPDELTVFAAMVTAPPDFPALPGRRALAVAAAWCGDLAEGERVLAPLRAAGPAADLIGPIPYVALQSMLDALAPHGWRFYDRLHYLPEVGDGFIDALVEAFERSPTPETHVMTGWLGGAIDRVAPGATAFGHRGARALTWFIGCSGDGPLDEAADWVRDTWEATKPFAADGVYVNALNAERPVRDAYADDVWDRLLAVKRRYDPEGAFAGNGIG